MARLEAIATRRRAGLSLVLALVVTTVVTVPLAIIASQATPKARTDRLELLVLDSGQTVPADGAVLDLDQTVRVVWDDQDIVGARFAFFVDEVRVTEGETVGRPPLFLEFDTGVLGAGRYEVLATGTTADGEERQRAAAFTVRDR